jgi:hypothetical protein
MEFDFDERGMQVLAGQVTDLTEWLANRVAHQGRKNCPVKTGRLRRTIVAYGNRVYIGGPDAPYWYTVEFGSPPHLIRPRQKGMGRGHRRKKALSWPDADHPVAVVHHPGTPEQAPLRRALYGANFAAYGSAP